MENPFDIYQQQRYTQGPLIAHNLDMQPTKSEVSVLILKKVVGYVPPIGNGKSGKNQENKHFTSSKK